MSDNLWVNDHPAPPNNPNGLSSYPAAATYKGRIYVFHQGKKNDKRIWFATFDGTNWSSDQLARPNAPYQIDGAPALVVFGDKMYCFYRWGTDVRYFAFDGQNWGHFRTMPQCGGFGGNPSVAIFRNFIHFVCRQASSPTNLYSISWTMCQTINSELPADSADAGTDYWFAIKDSLKSKSEYLYLGYQSPPDPRYNNSVTTSPVLTDGSPTLAVYGDRLYCFHKGSSGGFETDQLVDIAKETAQVVLDGDPRDAPMAIGLGGLSIAIASIGQAIKLNGTRESDWTWVTSYDGNNWTEDQLCPTAEDAYGVNGESVAAIEYQKRLMCIRQGRDNSWLWCGEFVGGKWAKDQTMGVPGNTFCATGAPALAILNDTLYCFYQGKNDCGDMYMTSVTSPPPPPPAPVVIRPALQNSILISCDNQYRLFVNCQGVGAGADWMNAGNYPVSLIPGQNLVDVLAVNSGGPASLLAEVRVGVRIYSSGSYDWRVNPCAPVPNTTLFNPFSALSTIFTDLAVTDQSMATATEYGTYGCGPWNTNVAGFPTDSRARWIWDGPKNDVTMSLHLRLRINTSPDGNRDHGIQSGNAPHSVAAWVKVNAMPGGRAWIMLLGNATTGAHHWLLSANGSTQFGVWGGTGQLGPSLPLQKWVHVAMTYDGHNLTCYLNGTLWKACPAVFNLQGMPLVFGLGQNGEEDFKGWVQDVRVYNRALAAAEVLNTMNGKG